MQSREREIHRAALFACVCDLYLKTRRCGIQLCVFGVLINSCVIFDRTHTFASARRERRERLSYAQICVLNGGSHNYWL